MSRNHAPLITTRVIASSADRNEFHQLLHSQHGYRRRCHSRRRGSISVQWPTRDRYRLLHDRPRGLPHQHHRCGFPCNLPLGKFQRFILRPFGWDVHSLYPFGGSDALCRDYGLWSALLWVLVDKGDVRGVLGVCRVQFGDCVDPRMYLAGTSA